MTPAERSIEMVSITHEGVAVLDRDLRFRFANPRAATVLGRTADALLGQDLLELVPELPADDAWATIASGSPFRLEFHRTAPDGDHHFVRATLLARPAADGTGGLLLLCSDVTALRAAQAERRSAQRRLTAVEEAEHVRIGREIHDGPIQILAAVTLRLGTMSEPELQPADIDELESAIQAASADLRRLMRRPDSADLDDPSAWLVRWTAPLVDGSPLALDIDDSTDGPPNRPTAEALFVFLHEAIVGVLDADRARSMHVRVFECDGGYRMNLDVSASRPGTFERTEPGTRFENARRYARELGGWCRHEMLSADVRRFSVWIPRVDDTEPVGVPTSAASRHRSTLEDCPSGRPDVEVEVELTAADLDALSAASYEGLMEFDRDDRILYVNDAWVNAMKHDPAEVVGVRLENVFLPADWDRLDTVIRGLRSGQTLRWEWQRANAVGEQRWAQVTAAPRVDAAGEYDGGVAAVLDTTGLHVTQDLRNTALHELDRARHAARRSLVQTLGQGPIGQLIEVNETLKRIIGRREPSDAMRTIQAGLEESIVRLQRSVRFLTEPDLSGGRWDVVLLEMLTPMLEATSSELVVVDDTADGPPPGRATALVRIAREAVANALLHGKAPLVRVTLSLQEGGYRLRVDDDGAGFDIAATRPQIGHVGIQSMIDRAAEQDGSLEVESRPGHGTTVTTWVPVVGEGIFVA